MPRKPTVRYTTADDPDGVTPSQLKRLSKKRQLEVMEAWFRSKYQDPAHDTPHNTREGGYQYIWGGPYDASDELQNEFGGVIRYEVIEKLVDSLQDETIDWAPIDHGEPDNDPPDTVDFGPEEDVPDSVIPASDAEQRKDILRRIEAVEAALRDLQPVHGGIGHNHPPETPEEAKQPVLTEGEQLEAAEALQGLREAVTSSEPDMLVVEQKKGFLKKIAAKLTGLMGWAGKKAGEETIKAIALTSIVAPEKLAAAYAKIQGLIHAVETWALTHLNIPF